MKKKTKAALILAGCAVVSFAGIFACAFICFGASEWLCSQNGIDYPRLIDDTLGLTVKIWIGAMIVLGCRVCYDLRNKR